MGYRDVFKSKHTFLAVVHVEDEIQALRNAEIAYTNGADGIFLINHEILVSDLLDAYSVVRRVHSEEFIGLNCLGMYPWEMFTAVSSSVSALWADNAGIREQGSNPVELAEISWETRKECSDWKGLYFGGVAFKYQEQVSDPGYVARLAMPYVDVVTTSGEGTGAAPSVSKIKKMRSAIGPDMPLAIASGMTPENVSDFMPIADCFIVATGISKSFTELDPKRVAHFAKILGKKV